jgi:cell division septal protein FtsQ
MRTADAGHHHLRRWTIAGVVVVLVAASAVAMTYTPLFAATDIRLRGTTGISRAEVLVLARVDHRSNVFHLDTRAVERRLERDPRILAARVATSLPDRVSIEIVPRTPVAVSGAPEMLVGADGVVIGPAGRSVDLPSMIGPDGGPVGTEALRAAAATAGALGPALRGVVEAVVVTPHGALEVRLEEGFSASFGDASDLEAKAASLAALLAWVEEMDVTVVSADLTVPGSPTAQLKKGSAPIAVT